VTVRKAIVTSVHGYDGPFQVGAHGFARALAALGWDVLFLSDPASSVHVAGALASARLRRRVQNAFWGVGRDAATGVRYLTPITATPLAGAFGANSALALETWPRFTIPPLRNRLARLGFGEIDLVMLDGAISAPLVGLVRARRTVLRLFDRVEARQGLSPALLAAERTLARRVDAVAITARDLEADAAALGARRVVELPNGVDLERFDLACAAPTRYAAVPPPRLVYVGAFGPWVDGALLDRLAAARPDVSMVLIGPPGPALDKVGARPNVHRLGAVGRRDLPPLLVHADVGLVPFDRAGHGALVDGVNPLKLYEYWAAGLPAVATRTRELARLSGPVALADGGEAFLAAIDAALAGRRDRAAIRAHAAAHDWTAIATRFLADLG
jgi:glycosyltransferase involved in cell wall biosynthesis